MEHRDGQKTARITPMRAQRGSENDSRGLISVKINDNEKDSIGGSRAVTQRLSINVYVTKQMTLTASVKDN